MSAILLAVLLALAGRALPVSRWTVRLMAGAVMFHLLLTAYDFLGVRWGRVAVVLPLLVLAGLGRRTARTPRTARTLDWGEGAALFALTTFAAFAPTLWITTPDFIFHWGLKGERFFLARGVDYSWLAKEWNWVIHPDYPNLLPELFAGTAILEGRFEASPQMLWSVLFFALILVSGREALRQTDLPGKAPRPFAPAGLAIAAFALAGFGIVHRMAGAADWMPALALAAALPALLRPADREANREGDWEVGIAAAFAATSKIEGMPLAAFLAGVQLLRRREMGAALRLGLPMAVVAGTWAIQTFRHGLYQKFNSGTFDLGRAPEVLRGLAEVAGWKESWHGLTLVLLAAPLLLLPRRTRAAGAVISLQLLFYLWTYLSSAVDTEYQVVASFPRLAMHLFPAVVVAGVVALGESRGGACPRPGGGKPLPYITEGS
ncbi:MAG TPA: hypothetical protein VF179_32460 [Thermoanaerobaculia bacterium]|nr:hypothetical protein [Thermoanaerobaculia bacterium]